MDCRRCQAQLSEYLDGELPAARSSPVARHLAGCDACAAMLADLARVRDEARALLGAGPRGVEADRVTEAAGDGDDAWARMAAKLEADEERERLRRWRRQLLGGPWPWLSLGALVIVSWSVFFVGGPVLRTSVRGTVARRLGPPVDPRFAPVSDEQLWRSAATAVAASDALYARTANELRAQVEAERVAWPAERQRRFDGHVDDFQLMRLRQQAALRAHGLDASSVSAMHAAWRGEIDYLEEAVLPAAAGDVHP